MEENGNDDMQGKDIGKILKHYADLQRAEDKAREAGRAGQPFHTMPAPTAVHINARPVDGAQTQVSTQVKTIDADEGLMTSAQAARFLGYTSEKSFRNAVSARRIPHYKLFDQNRFKKSELLGLLVKVEVK